MIIAPGMDLELSFSLNFQFKNSTKVHGAKSRVTVVIWSILIATSDLKEKIVRKECTSHDYHELFIPEY